MTTVQYINSNNQVIELLSDSLRIMDASFHNYTWGYDSTTRQYGAKITRFTKEVAEYEATLIFRGTLRDRKDALNEFTETAERDLVNMSPGKLVWGDYYTEAYVISSRTEPYEGTYWTQKDVTFLCPYPFWIRESTRSFPKVTDTGEDNDYLDYEYDYPYDYSLSNVGSAIWTVGHYAACEFLLTIYGTVINPRIIINGHAYEVYTDLGVNDYLKIDSRNNTVVKYLSNGTQQDCYGLRAKQESVFESIEAESVTVEWSGEFGFDLTLFCERSEPEWTT